MQSNLRAYQLLAVIWTAVAAFITYLIFQPCQFHEKSLIEEIKVLSEACRQNKIQVKSICDIFEEPKNVQSTPDRGYY